VKLVDLRARLAPGVAEERRRQEAATVFKGPACPTRSTPHRSTVHTHVSIADMVYQITNVNIRGGVGGGQVDFCISDLALGEGGLLAGGLKAATTSQLTSCWRAMMMTCWQRRSSSRARC